MSLIERYVYAVTKHLPHSQRDDIAQELRATIEDMVADRAKNGKSTEADVTKVLEELGDPGVLATKYSNQKRYLIGPKWYDAYISLLKQLLFIVTPIIVAITLVANFMNSNGTDAIAKMIINAIGSGISVGIQTAFWVTLTFVFLERASAAYPQGLNELKNLKQKNKPWTPDQLPFPPKKRQIALIESVSSAALIALSIAWVAFSPLINSRDGQQLFNPELWNIWMPVFFILAGLALVHKLFQVKIGNWTPSLVVTNILLGVAGIVYVLALVMNIQVLNVEFLHTFPTTNGVSFDKITEWARWTVGIAATAFIGTYIWDMIGSIRLGRQLKK